MMKENGQVRMIVAREMLGTFLSNTKGRFFYLEYIKKMGRLGVWSASSALSEPDALKGITCLILQSGRWAILAKRCNQRINIE